MIAIVNYGMGNLFSIYNAMSRVGADPKIVRDPDGLKEADGIVIPAWVLLAAAWTSSRASRALFFRPSMKECRCWAFALACRCSLRRAKRALGPELGWIEGKVVRLPEGVMIPQMGWNSLTIKHPVEMLNGIFDGDMFYFVHSYYGRPKIPR